MGWATEAGRHGDDSSTADEHRRCICPGGGGLRWLRHGARLAGPLPPAQRQLLRRLRDLLYCDLLGRAGYVARPHPFTVPATPPAMAPLTKATGICCMLRCARVLSMHYIHLF